MMINVHVILHAAVPRAQDRAPDVFIKAARHISPHSPLERTARGETLRVGFLGRRGGDGARRLLGQDFVLAWRFRGVPRRGGVASGAAGHRRAATAVCRDAVMAAAVTPAARDATVAASARLARSNCGRHIF